MPKYKNTLKESLLPIAIILASGIGLLFIAVRFNISFMANIGHTILIAGGLYIICRFFIQFLWERYPWEYYPVTHIILEVVGLFVMTIAYGYLLYFVESKLGLFDDTFNLWIQALLTLLITYLVSAIHEMLFFYEQWILHFSKSAKLEKDNVVAKYETLKTQVNPHFLFNSLNSLTNIVDDNPKAVEYISNLSDLMRYMLSRRDSDLVSLQEELKILNNYITLQKTRFRNGLVIIMDIDEKYLSFLLPPLALQMLVENCIKHNVIRKNNPLRVTIRTEDDYLIINNNLQLKSQVPSTGQGLKNITERYKFFSSKALRIKENGKEFSVAIPLLEDE